jgi:hypothetical protein
LAPRTKPQPPTSNTAMMESRMVVDRIMVMDMGVRWPGFQVRCGGAIVEPPYREDHAYARSYTHHIAESG